jgi:hypothetical protein
MNMDNSTDWTGKTTKSTRRKDGQGENSEKVCDGAPVRSGTASRLPSYHDGLLVTPRLRFYASSTCTIDRRRNPVVEARCGVIIYGCLTLSD